MMRKLLNVLICITISQMFSGCVEQRYYRRYHRHREVYYRRHHIVRPGVEIKVRG